MYRLKKHVEDPDSNPLLVFPEGTCVNNEYTVMFKKVGKEQLFCLHLVYMTVVHQIALCNSVKKRTVLHSLIS
jgi:hypothetical protein